MRETAVCNVVRVMACGWAAASRMRCFVQQGRTCCARCCCWLLAAATTTTQHVQHRPSRLTERAVNELHDRRLLSIFGSATCEAAEAAPAQAAGRPGWWNVYSAQSADASYSSVFLPVSTRSCWFQAFHSPVCHHSVPDTGSPVMQPANVTQSVYT